MNEIEQIFKLLRNWYKLPKYQLERRLDIFFVLYLPDILSNLKGIHIKSYDNILPEFPIKKDKNCASNNADYAILVNDNDKIKLKLVELKTDINSIKKKNQIEYYKNIKSFQHILSGIIEIENKTKSKDKYCYLLEKLAKFKVIKENENEKPRWSVVNNKINDDIDILYIVPKKTEGIIKELNGVIKEENIITFENIIDVLNKKDDVISKQFCNLLSDVMLNN